MGLFNIYYTVKRDKPLNEKELEKLDEIITRWDDSTKFPDRGNEFYLYEDEEPPIVLAGETHLPMEFEDEAYEAALYWAGCLTEIRKKVLPKAEWEVLLDNQEFDWDDVQGWYLD